MGNLRFLTQHRIYPMISSFGLLLPSWLVYVAVGLVLALIGGLIVLARRLRQYRDQLDLEEARSQRMISQFSAPAWHPDRQPQPEPPVMDEANREDLLAEKEELAEKYERLRATYIKLFDRHKALVKQYERLAERRMFSRQEAPRNGTPVAANPVVTIEEDGS